MTKADVAHPLFEVAGLPSAAGAFLFVGLTILICLTLLVLAVAPFTVLPSV